MEQSNRLELKVSAGSRPGGRTFESLRSGYCEDPGSRDSYQIVTSRKEADSNLNELQMKVEVGEDLVH